VSNNNWRQATSWDEVCRRNAGRRAYNFKRGVQREVRLNEVVNLLVRYGLSRGVQSRVARELGVSRSVVCRDIQALMSVHAWCPFCGSFVLRERLRFRDRADSQSI
jgi:hypothetical protein